MSAVFPAKSCMKIMYFYVWLLLNVWLLLKPKKNTSLAVTSDLRLSLNRLIFFCIAKYRFPQKNARIYRIIQFPFFVIRSPSLVIPSLSSLYISLSAFGILCHCSYLFLSFPILFILLSVCIVVSHSLSFSFSLRSAFLSKVRTVRLMWYRFKRIFDCFTSVSDSSSAIYAELL
jgi:hypothetical protein